VAKSKKKKPWHEELNLRTEEMLFLKRLLGIEKKYRSIEAVEQDYLAIIEN
jgi:serine/threonine-protein kinase